MKSVPDIVKRSDRYEWTLYLPHTGPGIVFDQYLSHQHQIHGISRSTVHRVAAPIDSPPRCEIYALPSGRRLSLTGPLRSREIREAIDEFMGAGRIR